MAGVATEFNGQAEPIKGIRVGFSSQELHTYIIKSVRANFEEVFAAH